MEEIFVRWALVVSGRVVGISDKTALSGHEPGWIFRVG
jgi:hypothetical protein